MLNCRGEKSRGAAISLTTVAVCLGRHLFFNLFEHRMDATGCERCYWAPVLTGWHCASLVGKWINYFNSWLIIKYFIKHQTFPIFSLEGGDLLWFLLHIWLFIWRLQSKKSCVKKSPQALGKCDAHYSPFLTSIKWIMRIIVSCSTNCCRSYMRRKACFRIRMNWGGKGSGEGRSRRTRRY